MQNINNTQYFRVEKEPELQVKDVLAIVYRALSEKGLINVMHVQEMRG